MALVLTKGSRGEEVKKLQAALHLLQDGIFGIVTEEAVKVFQKANGLKADGIVGEKTWEMLLNSKTSLKISRRMINKIIVHCTATPEGRAVSVAEIRSWHTLPKPKGNGWSDIGYHYIIGLKGELWNGRDVDLIGAHCENQNANSIGVVYVGGVDKNGKPKDTRTIEQKNALVKLLRELRRIYPKAKIYGHRDFSSKACPSFDAKSEYSKL